ncbi:MAG: tRNA uridine-5-carboxymethylaminomethyl(34) synthesis GTPase MnmE [Gammaproteobacteria bacterium]|nr:tRNA uridine-5-carboxymethylaminomethyl(34) synthesis GTPase MnmE [Gammaproteobacteria bacterium]
MQQSDNDTIVALATPPGRGGIGIVRLSGPNVSSIAFSLLGKRLEPRVATSAQFTDANGVMMDSGLAIYFAGPASFTGEDVLELHGHGGPVPMDMLIQHCLLLGARLAGAGEFTQRAFLNDKIDLTQAEAISDLIDSASQQAARAAVRSLCGEFAHYINDLAHEITSLRMFVEAAIDFPEEEIDFLADQEVTARLDRVARGFTQIEAAATQGQLLRDGMILVIVGRPNVGKSSLLNRLAGYDAAIVTAQAGTTRDILREDIHIDGMPLHIVDTAGLHESSDPVEIEGMRRARRALKQADHVLYISDRPGSDDFSQMAKELPRDIPVTTVINKIDINGGTPGVSLTDAGNTVGVSALTGEGLDDLRDYLGRLMGYSAADSGQVIARRRHLDALARARVHFTDGKRALLDQGAGEIMAEELRLAQNCLGEITGQVTSDELLGQIFSNFCIGK